MKYIRLRIGNYRGVTEAEIDFGETGITLVRGPNEVGKTSLGEAIRLLFDYPDNSKHREVAAIRPVDRDVGPEIELEAESGPYRFVYAKRFFKRPATTLRILRPSPFNLLGRDAHERANTILKETLDVDLWKALSIRQGSEVEQPALAGQTWLSAALDKAAGGHSVDAKAESLFDQVKLEYLRYYTEGGAERKNLAESRDVLGNRETGVREIEQAIVDLDRDIDRASRVKREIERLKHSEQDIAGEVQERAAKLAEIGELENCLSDARHTLDAALARQKAARAENDSRTRLIDDVKAATMEVAEGRESADSSLASLDQAKDALETAQQEYSSTKQKYKETLELLELRRRDQEYLRSQLDLEMLHERKARIDIARESSSKAATILAKNKVDAKALASIEEAQRSVLGASAKLEAKAPVMKLRGLNPCTVRKDGVTIRLKKGEELSYPVPDVVRVVVPSKLEMEMIPGSSVETLMNKLEEAKTRAKDICASYGISTVDDAREAFEEQRRAAAQIATLEQVERENLRDLTYERLASLILGLEQSVPAYVPARVKEPLMPKDLDSAAEEVKKADKLVRLVEKQTEEAESRFHGAKKVCDTKNGKCIETRTAFEHYQRNLVKLEQALERDRAAASDAAIDLTLSEAVETVAQAKVDVGSIELSLRGLNPEKEKDLDQTARDSQARIQSQLREADRDLVEVATRLKINGEDGLYDKLRVAQGAFERAKYVNASLEKRAAAAALLYDTINAERDRAHHAYIAPLKDRVEALGRLVFDETLQVEIDDNLRMVSRTYQGATVEFESLSGGTKEQLSLIFRLACAMIVAKDGGAPVILDDTLGYTDPSRLRLMGAVLAKAARDCQIVILTCMPDRYWGIGAAKEIVMGLM